MSPWPCARLYVSILSQFSHRLFTEIQYHHYHPHQHLHFTEEETGLKSLRYLLKVIQLVRKKGRTPTQVYQIYCKQCNTSSLNTCEWWGQGWKGRCPFLKKFQETSLSRQRGRRNGEERDHWHPPGSWGPRVECRSANRLTYQVCPAQTTPGCHAKFWKWYFQRNTDNQCVNRGEWLEGGKIQKLPLLERNQAREDEA